MSQYMSSKEPTETIVVSFDFSNLLGNGETITACTCTATDRRTETDMTATMILNAADLSSTPVIKQMVQGGLNGSSYLIRATVTTSRNCVLTGAAVLPIVTES